MCAACGAGLPKHHIANANLMRNGADYAVYLNTAQVRPAGCLSQLKLAALHYYVQCMRYSARKK